MRKFAQRATPRMVCGEPPVEGDEIEGFWALRNVSFDVEQGEVLSLSPARDALPLTGVWASLLEIGRGFHPKLSGRQNIFLNGCILGMSRAEIQRKFDEIVAFAQIDRFVNTPVKRYSSGIFVRLAFTVAAHFEPEILVVDEVLAVGDLDFQKKCLGKMREVSAGGRTVLLVSYNMSAIRNLASRCLVMSEGAVVFDGQPDDAIIKCSDVVESRRTSERSLGRGESTAIQKVRLVGEDGAPTTTFTTGEPLRLDVVFSTDGKAAISLKIVIVGADRQKLALASLQGFHEASLPRTAGVYRTRLETEPLWLASGDYSVDVATSIINSAFDHYVEEAVSVPVLSSNRGNQAWDFKQSYWIGSFALGFLPTPTFERIDD